MKKNPVKKRYFLRMLLVLIALEVVRLFLHFLENTLEWTLFSGILLLILFYLSLVSNKRFLIRLPLRSKYSILFFVMVFIQIPLQIYVIWFQLRWYFSLGSFPIEVVSLGSYTIKCCSSVSSFLEGNTTGCVEKAPDPVDKDYAYILSNFTMRLLLSASIGGLGASAGTHVVKSDLFFRLWARTHHNVSHVTFTHLAQQARYFSSKRVLDINSKEDLAIIRKMVKNGDLSLDIPFQSIKFTEGLWGTTSGLVFYGLGQVEGLGISQDDLEKAWSQVKDEDKILCIDDQDRRLIQRDLRKQIESSNSKE